MADEPEEEEGGFPIPYPDSWYIDVDEQRRATIGLALIAAQVPVMPLAEFEAMVLGLSRLFEHGVVRGTTPALKVVEK